MDESEETLRLAAIPQAVHELAARLGVGKHKTARRAMFNQTGHLRASHESGWMPFKARQWICLSQCDFRWLCKTGPLFTLRIEDSLINAKAVGKMSLLGVIPLGTAQSSPSIIKAQLMRYLAELPWAPDAILHNSALRWTVDADGKLGVGLTIGDVSGSVTFELNDEGFLESVSGIRPRAHKGAFIDTPWRGIFSNYQQAAGRNIPMAGEVGWSILGAYHRVWKGELSDWHLSD